MINYQEYADVTFLALTVWREARGESEEGKIAVAMSIINRVKSPSWWGNDVQSVIFKKWQYSSLTDPKDPQLTTWPKTNDKSWSDCLCIAYDVLFNLVPNSAPSADSYYDISIKAPYWADDKFFVKQIGRLKFYNLDQDNKA